MLFKVWNSSGVKKAVVVNNFQSLLQSGCEKLGIENVDISVYLEDGTEIDDDDVLQCLPSGAVIYLLRKDDQKPWLLKGIQDACASGLQDVDLDCSSESSECVSDSSLNLKQKQWPANFTLPKKLFSDDLNKALKVGQLPWSEKSELLNHLANEIKKYTFNPTISERNQVACLLVEEFPALRSNIGDGYFAWSNRIYDKMREIRRKRRGPLFKKPNQNVSKDAPNPKTNSKFKKRRTRGEINVMPDAPDGEDNVSLMLHKTWLQKEFKKDASIREKNAINHKMELTFYDRRSLIIKDLPLTAIRAEYPFLFTPEGMVSDFRMLMNFDVDKTFLFELNNISSYLLSQANYKAKKHKELKEILETFNNREDTHLNDNLIACILILPWLFSEKSEHLYKIYPPETSWMDIKDDPLTPHVAVIGNPYDSTLNFIVAEKEVLFENVEFLQTVILCVAMYYCCNIKYPSKAKCLYDFIDHQILKNNQKANISRKVSTLMGKVNRN